MSNLDAKIFLKQSDTLKHVTIVYINMFPFYTLLFGFILFILISSLYTNEFLKRKVKPISLKIQMKIRMDKNVLV